MFINIRGPFGSGKSTIMMNMIKTFRDNPEDAREESLKVITPREGKLSHIAHKFYVRSFAKPIIVMGRYVSFSGGADTISWKGSQEQMTQFIRDNIQDNHIFLEGAIVSGCPRYVNLGKELQDAGHWVVYYYLTVTFDECIARIEKRRLETAERKNRKPVTKPLNIGNLQSEYLKTKKQIALARDLALNIKYIETTNDVHYELFELLQQDELGVH